jgi:pilus assembly protein Flp/PilA
VNSSILEEFIRTLLVGSHHGPRRPGNNGRGPLIQPRVDPKEQKMKSLVVRYVKCESGATAIEYGLIAAGISVAIIAVVQGLGTKLTSTFKSVSDNLK